MTNKNKSVFKKVTLIFFIFFIIFLIQLTTSGFFHITSTYADVFSISSKQTIAKSDNWEFCIPEKDSLTPYFIYKGPLNMDLFPYIIGKIFYKDNDEIDTMDIGWYLNSDRHFFIGERRWYFYFKDKNIIKVSFKVVWEEYGEICSESISSNNLTVEEIQEINKWIENHDKNYAPPFTYPELSLWKRH